MERRTLGLSQHNFCDPFARAAATVQLHVVRENPSIVSRNLVAGAYVAGFAAPLDFARNASLYRIIPGSGVASAEANGVLTIRFREGARSINTLAVSPISSTDIILARLLLSEKFGLAPTIVPVDGPVEAMLAKADAALIASLTLRPDHPDEEGLDLVEEWIDATGLPYVHGIIAARDGILQDSEINALSAVGLPPISVSSPLADDDAQVSPFTYGLNEEILDGLKEFLQYAYFHGILPDVPDLKLLGEE
jgi:predicted solute-binding protein